MSTKFKSVGPVGPAAGDGGPWSEDDKRELRLVLMPTSSPRWHTRL
jgi:hypothetical protein